MPRLLAITVLLLCHFSFAQWNWPVQVNAIASPNSNNYLSYFSDQNNHFQVLITLTDQNATTVPARLKIRLEGSNWWVETSPNANISSFNITPFETVILSGFELQPYFYESNLIKSSASLDLNNLPEGNVDVCIEVLGVGGTLTTIGGVQCGYTQIAKLDVPQLILPECASNLDTNTQFQQFLWSPPNGCFAGQSGILEYRLRIQEAVDPNNQTYYLNPNFGLITPQTPEFWTPATTTTINALDYQFQVGMTYIWRVETRLLDVNGIERPNMFQNGGLSNYCTFVWGEPQSLEEQLASDLAIDLNAFSVTQYKGHANWNCVNPDNQGLEEFDSYIIEYRLKPDNEHPNPIWHFDTVATSNLDMYQLSPEKTYQVRVSGSVGNYTSAPTAIVEFTTPPQVDYACGDIQIPFRPNQFDTNYNVKVGDQVQIGQFLMTMTDVNTEYIQGRYSGKGWIPVDFLGGARAKVSFENIFIDEEYIVRDGRVDVATDGVDNWLYEELKDHVDPIFVDGGVDSIWVDTTAGIAWVTIDGVQYDFVFDPPDYPIVINDANGYSFTIWPNGVIEVSGFLNVSSDHLDVSLENTVQFQQNSNEKYGFDSKEFMAWHQNYEVIQLSDSTYYFVANKSVGKDDTDVVEVQIPNAISPVFKLNDQDVLSSTESNGLYTVQIPAIASSGAKEIYVYNDVDQRIGKLNVFVFPEKSKDVVIVPVANASIDSTALQIELEETFREANLNVNFSMAPSWNNAEFPSNAIIELPTDVSVLSAYSGHMKELREHYFLENQDAPTDAYYLFIVQGFDNPDVRGYMPRGKAIGFVAAGGSMYHDIAHELSHGIGALEHSWGSDGPEKGVTNNLMDYSNNPNVSETNELIKAQWYALRDAHFLPNIWDDSEDGLISNSTYTEEANGVVNTGISWTSHPSIDDIFEIAEHTYVQFENANEIDEYGFKNGSLHYLYIDSHVLVLQKTGYILSPETMGGLQVASVKTSDRYNFVCTHSSCSASRELSSVAYNGVPKQIIKEYADHDTRFGMEIKLEPCESIEGDVITGYDHQNNDLVYDVPECPPMDPNSFNIPSDWFTDDLSVCFMTPDGKTFKMSPLGVRSLEFSLGLNEVDSLLPAGCLTRFKVKEDISTDVLSTFEASYHNGEFTGYLRSDGAKYFNAIRPQSSSDFGVIMLPITGGMGAFKYEASHSGYAYYDTLGTSGTSIATLTLENAAQAIKGYPIELLGTYGFAPEDITAGTINDAYSSEMYHNSMTDQNEQYRLVVKILELRSQYPELYNKMSVCDFGDWGCFAASGVVNFVSSATISAIFSASVQNGNNWGYFDYFYQHQDYHLFNRTVQLQKFLSHFLELIALQRQQHLATINSILNPQWCSEVLDGGPVSANHPDWSPEEIFNALEVMSTDEIKQVCMGTRISLIGALTFKDYVTDKYEKSIYRLIKHVSAQDEFELIQELCNREYNNTVLIKKIPEVVDDQVLFFGSGNYFTEILNQLITYYVSHPNQVNTLNLNQLDSTQILDLRSRMVTYHYDGFVKRLVDQCGGSGTANMISNISNVNIVKQGGQWRVAFEDNLQTCFISSSSFNTREYAIMEPLLITDKANLIEIYDNNSSPMALPAFALYFIEEKASAKTTVEIIETAIDVATLFVPGTQGKMLFRVLNYADKASSLSNMGANYSELSNPELSQILAFTSAITGFADISGSAVTKFKSLRSASGAQKAQKAVGLIDKSPAKLLTSHEAKVRSVLDKIADGTDPILQDIVQNSDAVDVVEEILEVEKASALKNAKVALANDIDDAIAKLNVLKNSAGGSTVTYFNQLDNATATTLNTSALSSIQSNLTNQGLVRFDVSPNVFETPATFLNETGTSYYEMVLDNTYYVKYDLGTGKIFVANQVTGEFYGFAQEKNLLILQSGQGANVVIRNHIQMQADKVKTICGLDGGLSITIFGINYSLDAMKTSTALGRMADISQIKNLLGDFKNVDLGEIAGGLNILNRPDVMWLVNPQTWWDNYNLPWIKRAIQRSDDFYLTSQTSELDKLLLTTLNLEEVPTITAFELRELKIAGIKPKNIGQTKWSEICSYLEEMEGEKLFD